MSQTEPDTEMRFDPPGPGSWKLDAVHFPRPVTRYWAETHPEPFRRGFGEFTRFYGMLIDTLDTAYPNGFSYTMMRLAAPEDIPARIQRAQEVFDGRLWREQLSEWDDVVKPASLAAHREIQAVDPDALSEEALAAHLARCHGHHAAMITQHMRFTAAAMIPTGDFLAHAGPWSGLPPSDLLGLLRGAAPVSAGASSELHALVTAIAADPTARELLASDGDPALILGELRTLDGEAGRAVSAYLDLVGWRLLDGFDISGPCALELPDVLLRAIRVAAEGRDDETAGVEALTADVRAKVPEERRGEFDELLGEARLMYRLRDERGVFSDIWASGLMRRAALAAGRRLVAAGRLRAPEHMLDATVDEMSALLTGAQEPSAEELAARAEYRATRTAKDAPPILGDEPALPPDPSGLPPAAARVMGAMGIVMAEMLGSSEEPHEEHMLRGLAASRGVYEGPARRIAGPAEFDRIVKGDVLVTESTSEAFNILLPLLGAIVTDSGGLLSHSAIVAREYGIPGVVGTREATERIADGTRVIVDGDSGEVTVFA
ncbi:MAG: PEP-utilizing enzyme [Steroidobacteraceae bacterium]